MCCAELNANACLFLRHYRIEESDDVNAFFEQTIGHDLGQVGVIKHDRYDGAVAIPDIEPGCLDAFFEVVCVPLKLIAELSAFAEQPERGNTGSNNGWGEGVTEEIGTRTLTKQFDNFPASGGKSAHGAPQGFPQRSGNDVDPAHYSGEARGFRDRFCQ